VLFTFKGFRAAARNADLMRFHSVRMGFSATSFSHHPTPPGAGRTPYRTIKHATEFEIIAPEMIDSLTILGPPPADMNRGLISERRRLDEREKLRFYTSIGVGRMKARNWTIPTVDSRQPGSDRRTVPNSAARSAFGLCGLTEIFRSALSFSEVFPNPLHTCQHPCE
jgi:hypothetical protein